VEAYEFYATPENGVIVIPEQYRKKIKAGVKVIILEQIHDSVGKRSAKTNRKSDLLLAPTIATSGWKFSREAANER